MKLLLIFTLVAAAAARPEEENLYEKYENFPVDDIIANTRLLKAYTNCYINEGKCTPQASDFKSLLPETLETSCAKCSEKQKINVAKMIKLTKEKLPVEYEKLFNMLDPERKMREQFEEFVNKYSV